MNSPTLVLFGNRLSPFVEKVARCLQYKRLAFEMAVPTHPLELWRWNPQTGKMPVLEIDGERVVDSTFIARRIDEIFPDRSLLSQIPIVAAAQRNLEDWSDESLYWCGMALRWSPESAALTARQLAGGMAFPWRQVAAFALPRRIRATTLAQGNGRLPTGVLLRELAQHLDDLVTLLADKPFFYARQPGIADFALYGQFQMLRSGPTPEAGAMIDDRPALAAFLARVEEVTAN